MAVKIIFLEEFGKAFVPKRFIPILRKYMLKAGFNEVPYKFFGLLFYISAALTFLLYIIFIFQYLKRYSLFEIYIYSSLAWFAVQLFFAVFFILLVYFYLDLRIYARTKKIEEQLPEFLQVLSSNLRGGLTFEMALWAAINPRMDLLSGEMAKVSKKVMTGYEVKKALLELADKYDSLMLRRTVDLLISELESGGNIAELIDRIVDNLKETKALKDEMSASAIAYVIFISVIVIIIGPLLFALSSHLLIVIVSFVGKLSSATQASSNLPFSFSKVNVDPKDFRIFSTISIFVIALFSSMIVSIVEKGDIKGGVKYIPIYVVGSLAMYYFFVNVIKTFFTISI